MRSPETPSPAAHVPGHRGCLRRRPAASPPPAALRPDRGPRARRRGRRPRASPVRRCATERRKRRTRASGARDRDARLVLRRRARDSQHDRPVPSRARGQYEFHAQLFQAHRAAGRRTVAGSLGWADRQGVLHASSSPGERARSEHLRSLVFLDRDEDWRSVRERRPGISRHAQTHHRARRPDARCARRLTGVLVGALLIDGFKINSGSFDLGFNGLAVLDRRGRALLAGFALPRNTALGRELSPPGRAALGRSRARRRRRPPGGLLDRSAAGLDDRDRSPAIGRLRRGLAWVPARPRSARRGCGGRIRRDRPVPPAREARGRGAQRASAATRRALAQLSAARSPRRSRGAWRPGSSRRSRALP